jgi:hypothetical protein
MFKTLETNEASLNLITDARFKTLQTLIFCDVCNSLYSINPQEIEALEELVISTFSDVVLNDVSSKEIKFACSKCNVVLSLHQVSIFDTHKLSPFRRSEFRARLCLICCQ